ncbi:MAG: lipoate--protein ligase [Planctomycetes bacterium]|nr:lipoate--protein ligase [Planctomycetota bacterium]
MEITKNNALLVRDEARSGVENMRIDECLLQRAVPEGPIIIRIYRWSEPTLSLGHFQQIKELADDSACRSQPSLNRLPWVRRKTGGGAILHDQEVTYSFVIPTSVGMMEKGANEILYRAVHEAVRDGLIRLGLDASLSENCTCSTVAKVENKDPFLCFQRRTPFDLVVGAHKVLGSAQRRTRAGLLQHGSLLLRSSREFCPLQGIEDLANIPLGFPWQEWLSDRLKEGLGAILPLNCEDLELKDFGYLLR